MLERLADDVRVRLRHVALHMDGGQRHVAFHGELELELLVLLAGVVQELHGLGLLVNGLRLGQALRFDARGDGEFLLLRAGSLGGGLRLRVLGLHVALGLRDLGFGQAHVLYGDGLRPPGVGLGGDDLRLAQAPRRFPRGTALGLLLGGVAAFVAGLRLGVGGGLEPLGVAERGVARGLSGGDGLDFLPLGEMARGFLLRLGGDDLLDLLLLGNHVRLDERDLADALGGHAGLDVVLLLLLLHDALLLRDDRGALALHLDGGLGNLDFLVHLRKRDGALAADAGFLALLHGLLVEPLLLLLHGELALLHRAVHVLLPQANGLLGLDALAFDLAPASFDNLARLGLLVGPHLGDGAGLLGGVLLVAALLFALGDVGVGILLLHLHLRALGKLVGADPLALGDFGNLPDALGIEHVAGVVLVQRGLLQVINRHVLQDEAIEVLADGGLNLLAELGALGEQLVEFHLLAGGLERLGELRLEQLAELDDVRDALGREHLRDLADTFRRGVHADVEGHGDVGADVVLADEAVLGLAVDFQFLHGDVHQLHGLEDGHANHVVEPDAHPADADDDPGLARLNLPNANRDDEECREEEESDSTDDEGHMRVGLDFLLRPR